MNGISQVASRGLGPSPAAAAVGPGGEGGFATALRRAVERVNQLEHDSAQEIRLLLAGQSEDLHKTLLAVQKADLAFTLLLETRNKVVQAYQEIMRIQV